MHRLFDRARKAVEANPEVDLFGMQFWLQGESAFVNETQPHLQTIAF